jgi:hypothetical protein
MTIMTKERQHCRTIEDLKPTDKVGRKFYSVALLKKSHHFSQAEAV